MAVIADARPCHMLADVCANEESYPPMCDLNALVDIHSLFSQVLSLGTAILSIVAILARSRSPNLHVYFDADEE